MKPAPVIPFNWPILMVDSQKLTAATLTSKTMATGRKPD